MLDNSSKPVLVLLAVLTVMAVLVLLTGTEPRLALDDDFVEYWAAGRLALTGGNPYDPQQLMEVEKKAGWTQDRPLMMWNPPWTIPFVAPLALLDYHQARFVWFLISYGCLVFCVDWLWRFYNGPLRWRLWLPVLCITFAPALLVLELGNLTPIVLLGSIGFLHFRNRNKPFWAGAGLSVTLLKPHLLYLVWIVWGLRAILKRDLSCLAGAFVALALLLTMGLSFQPLVMQQYIAAVREQGPAEWLTPTWGMVMRLWLGWDRFELQFAPSVIGALMAAVCTLHLRDRWDWRSRFPWLVMYSVLTAAYGWHTDCVLLLPLIISTLISLAQDASHWARLTGWVTYSVINIGTFALWRYPVLVFSGDVLPANRLTVFMHPSALWYIVLAPLWWVWARAVDARATPVESL